MDMLNFQMILVICLWFLIGVNCANLKNSTINGNRSKYKADDRCIQKCGRDPGTMCEVDMTPDENIICGCWDETEVYDEKSHQCVDPCSLVVPLPLIVFIFVLSARCGIFVASTDRCTMKCGTGALVICEGEQTSDETTICSCSDKIYVYRGGCYTRCQMKCGVAWCTGDQTSYNTTICNCFSDYAFDKKSEKCEKRCSVKCGHSAYVLCEGDENADETTICTCTAEDRIFDEKSLKCIKRCTKKCGWDSNIKCGGNQTTDETTICGCKDPNRVYDKESQTCRVKCDCKNGICDTDENGNTTCKCLPEYGRVSDVRCEECGCGKGANCTFNRSSQTKNCICRKGYREVNGVCKVVDPCTQNPCKNNGKCENDGGNATCRCRAGYIGNFCEEVIDPCTPNPCKHDGKCENDGGNATCICRTGYIGILCEKVVDPCTPNPCKHDGICENDCGNATCICRTGYIRILCEKIVDPCTPNPCKHNGKCENDGGNATCMCRVGYIGKLCERVLDPCTPNPCKHEGKCENDDENAICICKTGYFGKLCEKDLVADPCFPNPCKRNAKCEDDNGNAKCICKTGYMGKLCETVDHCASKPCKNGGLCINKEDKYACACGETYGGKDCSENLWCFLHGRSACGEATCHYNNVTKKVSCNCPPDQEFDSKLKICKDPCTPNPCKSGGSCIAYGSKFKCFCGILYSGNICEHGNKTTATTLLAILVSVVLTFVCFVVFCCWKRNQKLKKNIFKSAEIHHGSQTVLTSEGLQNNLYTSALRI